jgi:magnesium-protoporphyrin O-methyltransferase
MDCCAHVRGLNNVFDEGHAQAEVKRYRRQGLDKHARALAEMVSARGVVGATVLEVGGGIGGLHLELLRRGAARALEVEISSAYLAAARSLTAQLGLRDRVEHRLADFAREAEGVPEAEVVVLHRVVCCYPDMPRLITAAAQHARRLLALSFPREAWYMRVFARLLNLSLWLTRSGFRFYLHPPEAILGAAAAAGLQPVAQKSSWPWQLVVCERASQTRA